MKRAKYPVMIILGVFTAVAIILGILFPAGDTVFEWVVATFATPLFLVVCGFFIDRFLVAKEHYKDGKE